MSLYSYGRCGVVVGQEFSKEIENLRPQTTAGTWAQLVPLWPGQRPDCLCPNQTSNLWQFTVNNLPTVELTDCVLQGVCQDCFADYSVLPEVLEPEYISGIVPLFEFLDCSLIVSHCFFL